MRCICLTLALCLVASFSGCRAQTASLSNPFLSPDRVPPPPTRTLVPGTAQSYYSGDPIPNSPAVVPPGAFPTHVPQGSPVVPPGGWNTVPQADRGVAPLYNDPASRVLSVSAGIPLGRIVNVGEELVQIQRDEQNLLFAPSPPRNFAAVQQPIAPVTPVPAPTALGQQNASQNFTPSLAVQPWTPRGGIAPNVTPTPYYQDPSYPNQPYPGQLASYQEPVEDPRAVRLRALPPGESASSSGVVQPVIRDGFRPQGSSLNRSAARPTSSNNSSSSFGPTQEAANRFGFDPDYQWVRGQLEHSEATNQWKLRYIPIQQSPDQFGGSVLIANPQVLGGVHPGEHVLLRGRIHTRGPGSQAYAPIYTVSVVQRQQL